MANSELDEALSEAEKMALLNPEIPNDEIVERDVAEVIEKTERDAEPRLRKPAFEEICKQMAEAREWDGKKIGWKEWRDNFGHKWLKENGHRAPVAKYRVTDRRGKLKPHECDAVDETDAIHQFFVARGVKQPSKVNCVCVCIEQPNPLKMELAEAK